MVTEVILPVLGETMNEGTIVSWSKREGDRVRKGDPLFTLESDKATLEVEAQADGVLRQILVPAGQTVPILTPVGLITASSDEDLSAYRPHPSPSAAASPSATASSQRETAPGSPAEPGRVIASPRARRLARERGVDLSHVSGTGPGGRIAERDVAASLESGPSRRASDLASGEGRASPLAQRLAADLGVDLSKLQGSGPAGRITRQDVERARPASVAATPPGVPRPLTRTQRLMAERMVASFTTAPHFYLHTDVDARALVNLRGSLLERVESETGVRLTYTDLLVKLCALTLARHPQAMAQWTKDGLILHQHVNVGVAVDTPGGLVVPVIRDADGLTLAEIARRRSDLSERARLGRLTPQDLELGVFTLTNLGMFPVDAFDAILNPPQAAILAVGRIKERALVEGGSVVAAPMMTLSLSVDHRVLDGAMAARFLGDFVEWIETPGLALTLR
jgi:pyruvate dehydrogenase E2 component (dihydrolipoamide acetyltransferase)